ncbi:MAG: hypothetical protein MSG64_13790 [Pyrinomonadaceae bacterium MAG19_C2-C3]|nr:hypothetical protein [Pyrinomonadaceae bacterium MAG19_C2-C3]
MDTNYLVALTNPKDQWHARAREVQREIGIVRLITTEFVLTEVLNYFAVSRLELRRAARLVHKFENNPNVEVIECTHEAFASGLALYEARLDIELQLDRLRFDERHAGSRSA